MTNLLTAQVLIITPSVSQSSRSFVFFVKYLRAEYFRQGRVPILSQGKSGMLAEQIPFLTSTSFLQSALSSACCVPHVLAQCHRCYHQPCSVPPPTLPLPHPITLAWVSSSPAAKSSLLIVAYIVIVFVAVVASSPLRNRRCRRRRRRFYRRCLYHRSPPFMSLSLSLSHFLLITVHYLSLSLPLSMYEIWHSGSGYHIFAILHFYHSTSKV